MIVQDFRNTPFSAVPRLQGIVCDVPMNHYAILKGHDCVTALQTYGAGCCPGLVIVSSDEIRGFGLMHLFSDARFYIFGETRIRSYAREATLSFIEALETKRPVEVFGFGGLKPEPHHFAVPYDDAVELFFDLQKQRCLMVESDE
jgi:hypothetical protein